VSIFLLPPNTSVLSEHEILKPFSGERLMRNNVKSSKIQ